MGFEQQELQSQVPGLRDLGSVLQPKPMKDGWRDQRTARAPQTPDSLAATCRRAEGGASPGWGGAAGATGRSRGEARAAGGQAPAGRGGSVAGPERFPLRLGRRPEPPRAGAGRGRGVRGLRAPGRAGPARSWGSGAGGGSAAGGASSGSASRFRFPPRLRLIPRPEGVGAERRTVPPTRTPLCLATRAPIPLQTPPIQAVSGYACMDTAPQGEKLAFSRFEVRTWGEGETLPWGRGDARGRAVRNAQALARGVLFCSRPVA